MGEVKNSFLCVALYRSKTWMIPIQIRMQESVRAVSVRPPIYPCPWHPYRAHPQTAKIWKQDNEARPAGETKHSRKMGVVDVSTKKYTQKKTPSPSSLSPHSYSTYLQPPPSFQSPSENRHRNLILSNKSKIAKEQEKKKTPTPF